MPRFIAVQLANGIIDIVKITDAWVATNPRSATLTSMAGPLREVPIRDASIRLGQFLKLADLIDTGSDAKAVIAAGEVTVNDGIEVRRGRQLQPGDTVTIGEHTARVART